MKNNKAAVEIEVINIIRKSLPSRLRGATINFDMNLKKDLNMDSLRLVELMLEIQSKFRIKISLEDSVNINTVRDVADIIMKYRNVDD